VSLERFARQKQRGLPLRGEGRPKAANGEPKESQRRAKAERQQKQTSEAGGEKNNNKRRARARARTWARPVRAAGGELCALSVRRAARKSARSPSERGPPASAAAGSPRFVCAACLGRPLHLGPWWLTSRPRFAPIFAHWAPPFPMGPRGISGGPPANWARWPARRAHLSRAPLAASGGSLPLRAAGRRPPRHAERNKQTNRRSTGRPAGRTSNEQRAASGQWSDRRRDGRRSVCGASAAGYNFSLAVD